MLIRLICIGTRLPSWVNEGFAEYCKRLPPDYALELVEIPLEKRTANKSTQQLLSLEAEKILKKISPSHLKIALAVTGQAWSTPTLAKHLQTWHDDSRNVDLIVGGPDGLSAEVVNQCSLQWSLSPLTLPHPLVRILLAEQIYRAWSIIQKHPYHR